YGEFKKQFYNDPAVFITDKAINQTYFAGKPLFKKHDQTKRIGNIMEAWTKKDQPTHLMILAEVTDEECISGIDSGKYGSLSIGYTVDLSQKPGDGNTWTVRDHEILEVSICERPFYPGSSILMTASDDATNTGVPKPFSRNTRLVP